MDEADAIARRERAPKTKAQCRKPSLNPVPETVAENDKFPVPETVTTVPVPETVTTSISGRVPPSRRSSSKGDAPANAPSESQTDVPARPKLGWSTPIVPDRAAARDGQGRG